MLDTRSAPFDATRAARWSTRLCFLAGGFAVASWAPLILAVKQALGLDAALFGTVLLCLGLGSVIAMPATGVIVARTGARGVIGRASLVVALLLPCLPLAPNGWVLTACLWVFGAALGALDVAMNVHGANVERREGRSLMSGFHAVFSIGVFAGAMLSTLLVWLGLPIAWIGVISALAVFGFSRLALPGISAATAAEVTGFVLPKGVVLVFAAMVAVVFLVEGAVLDWGALLIVERAVMDLSTAGAGFVAFSVGMVLMRLAGDTVIAWTGRLGALVGSGGVAALGMSIVLTLDNPLAVQAGFFLVGAGAACIAPILISAAGHQGVMPASQAVAAVTTAGYGGHLLGPALVGFVAQGTSLAFAFALLAGLIGLVPVAAVVFRNRL